MNRSVWPNEITKSSFIFLKQMSAVGLDFVLIGGWAAYFHAKHQQSKDIDIIVKEQDYWKLQQYLASVGGEQKESGLRKYGFKIGDVEIDIYTETVGELPISPEDIISKRLFIEVEGLKVLSPEALIVLKLVAEKHRHDSHKGLKDRCDILALLMLDSFDAKKFHGLIEQYNMPDALDQLKTIVRLSEAEFNTYLLENPLIPSKLRLLKQKLLEKLKQAT